MPKIKFTYLKLANLSKPDKITYYYDTVESGLQLKHYTSGTKTFFYRYRLFGKHRRYKIGQFPGYRLAKARSDVREMKVMVHRGTDPQEERLKKRQRPKTHSFKELSDLFEKRYLPNLKETTRAEYKRIIEVELLDKHKWGDIPARDITSQNVRKVLNDKAYNDDAFTMANRIRSTISKIFEFGMKHIGLDMQVNPVTNTPIFQQGENRRDRVYSAEEIKQLWDYLETRPEPLQSIFKILMLTGQRKTESLKMKWADITEDKPCKKVVIHKSGKPQPESFLANVWLISENKSNRPHELPLPDFTYNIIQQLKAVTGNRTYVFASQILDNKPLQSIKSTSEMIKRETDISDFRPHDLRRTIATHLQQLMVEKTTIKKILNHADSDVTGKHYTWYDYMDKKLEALERWSWRVESIVKGNDAATITTLSDGFK